jgi:hypothetical protein
MTAFSDSWLERFQERVNADPEMHVVGDWLTTALTLTCGERRCILRFDRGTLVEVISSPRLDVRCAFGFRASPDIWAKFLAPDPEPLYHDFFAMLMRVRGSCSRAHPRRHAARPALHRAMNLMRTVG